MTNQSLTAAPPAISLQKGALSLEIKPNQGARIWSIRHHDKEWLWQNPDWQKCQVKPGAEYDSNWVGGWDDLFPNDALGVWEGMNFPDHGEIWSSSWDVIDRTGNVSITLQYEGHVFPYTIRKKITLKDENSFFVTYEIQSRSDRDLPLLFKLHPAMAIGPGDRFEFPEGGRVEAVDPTFGTLDGQVSPVPALDRKEKEFIYIRGLSEGWFTVRDPKGNSFKMEYPLEHLPEFWIFMDWGGWRGYRVAVMEPCTNYPKDLAQAASRGRCLRLKAAEKLVIPVQVTLGASK